MEFFFEADQFESLVCIIHEDSLVKISQTFRRKIFGIKELQIPLFQGFQAIPVKTRRVYNKNIEF